MQQPKDNGAPSVQFHYIKSNHFRVIHGDGVWGGPTPRGYISMNVFSERSPIPQKIIHNIQDATLGEEIKTKREVKQGFVREVEVEVIMDLELAENLVTWLQAHIENVKKQDRKRQG